MYNILISEALLKCSSSQCGTKQVTELRLPAYAVLLKKTFLLWVTLMVPCAFGIADLSLSLLPLMATKNPSLRSHLMHKEPGLLPAHKIRISLYGML